LLVSGVLVAALAVAYLFFRGGWSIRPSGGEPAVKAEKKIGVVVVPFRAPQGAESLSWIGDAVSVFLTLNLEDHLELKVLTPERIFDLTRSAPMSSPESQLAMAKKGGARYLLRGEVSGQPGSVRLAAAWVDVSSGKEREHWTVDGIGEGNLGIKLDQLAGQVKKALGVAGGERQVAIASMVPVKEAPTRSFVDGAMQQARGDAAEALETLKEALALGGFPMAQFLEALASAQRGDPRRAVQAALPLAKISRPLPTRVTLMVPVILALYQSGDPRNAVAPLESFLARFPDEKHPLAWLGAIELFLLKEPNRAAEDFKKALALDPASQDDQRLLAQAILESGHPAEASKLLKKYLAGRPEDDPSRLLLARALRDAGDYPESTATVEQVLVREPENVSAAALKGALLLDQNNPQAAAAVYEKLAASSQPRTRAEARLLSGRLVLLTGRFREGLGLIRSAAEEAGKAGIPNLQGQYLMVLGQELTQLGRYPEALSALSEIRNLDASFDLDFSMISVLILEKEFDPARTMLDAMTSKWKGKLSEATLQRIRATFDGNVALEQGKYAEAVEHLQAALPAASAKAPASEPLARALLGAGQALRAAEIFQRIVKDPDRYADPVGYVRNLARLGEASEKANKKQEAIQAYRQVLQWWSSADSPRPETDAARQGLKRLGG
jgi:predicted Zn-dependent protease/TolB-like protein